MIKELHSKTVQFKDETVRPVRKADENQRILYNRHKRVHGIKFQSVVAPNGLIASLFGPVEGRGVDSGLLKELLHYSFVLLTKCTLCVRS